MAENSEEKSPFEEEEGEADVLFRAQMKVYDVFMGHWQKGATVVGVGLLGVLVYGLWEGHVQDTQREISASIAEVDRDQPELDQLAMLGLVPADDLTDPDRVALLKTLAARYEGVAADASGAGAALASLKAAETWRRLDDADAAASAYQAAIDADDAGILGYAAWSGLASIHLQKGEHAEAVALYRAAADANDGILGQSALMDLGLANEHSGDDAAAKAAYEEFKLRFGDSVRMIEVEQRLAALGGAGG